MGRVNMQPGFRWADCMDWEAFMRFYGYEYRRKDKAWGPWSPVSKKHCRIRCWKRQKLVDKLISFILWTTAYCTRAGIHGPETAVWKNGLQDRCPERKHTGDEKAAGQNHCGMRKRLFRLSEICDVPVWKNRSGIAAYSGALDEDRVQGSHRNECRNLLYGM